MTQTTTNLETRAANVALEVNHSQEEGGMFLMKEWLLFLTVGSLASSIQAYWWYVVRFLRS